MKIGPKLTIAKTQDKNSANSQLFISTENAYMHRNIAPVPKCFNNVRHFEQATPLFPTFLCASKRKNCECKVLNQGLFFSLCVTQYIHDIAKETGIDHLQQPKLQFGPLAPISPFLGRAIVTSNSVGLGF